MKKWTITVNLLFYITFLNQWKAVESQSASSSRGSQSAGGSPAGGQTSTPKSQIRSDSNSSQSHSSRSSSQPASSGSRSTQQTGTGGTSPGTQPSGTSSTPTSQSQPAKTGSQPTTPSSVTSSGIQSAKPGSTPPSSGTQPAKPASGTSSPASQSGTTPAKTNPTSGTSTGTTPPKASSGTPPSSATQQRSGGTTPPSQSQPSSTPASQTPTSQSSSQSTGTGTSAGQVSQSPNAESQPKSSSSPTDQSSSGSSSGTDGTVVNKSAVTPVTLDIEKTQSTSEFDYSKDGNFKTFTPKPNLTVTKIVKKNVDIWSAKPEDHGLKVVLMGSGSNEEHLGILLKNNNFLVLRKSDKNKPWEDITSSRHDITKLRFFGENDVELKSSDYEVDLIKLSYSFIFKSGVSCKKVTYNNTPLWNHTDDSKFSEINKFQLGLASNNFFVRNQSDEVKKIEKEVETGTSAGQGSQSPNPESQPESSSSGTPGTTKVSATLTPESEVITPKMAQQTGSAILTEPVPAKAAVTVLVPTNRPRPKKTPEVATGHRTAITLNIAEKASNSAVDFKEDYLKNVMVFSAMEKYVFNKIIKTGGSKCCGSNCCDSETVIWEAKEQNDHFHTVYVDGLGTFSKTKNMSLHLCNGNFIHLNGSDSGPWSESPAIVDLDVRISNSNIQVDYFQKDNYRIYVAKPGYTIRKVFKSKKCGSECCCSGLVIWEAQGEHALKVVLMGSKKEPKHLAVLMNNGELTLLSKSGSGKPWQDVTSTKNKITDLKMYAMADSKTVELHKGHYSITLFNEFYGYLFHEGIGCVKVTHKGKNIWDLREEGDFGCLKGVFLDLKSNKFNVMNDDDRCWVCEEVRKVNPVTLDISSKASTDDFDYTVDHNRKINIYTSKGNAMFYQVIKTSSTNCCGSTCSDSETVIWETEDPKGYASKVFADGVGACSSTKNVSIYLLNGDILHFGKGGRNEPWKPSDNKIILDVDKTSSTIAYDFVHHGETRTFTTKPGYHFKTVMLSSSRTWLVCGSSCCKSACLADHIFWEAQTEEECSTKVTVYGVETTVTNINIFLNNSQVKHFHKVKKKWVSTTSIVLNIEKNTDNDLFEYRSTRNFGHFNPKPNLTITKIVKKGLEIWNAKPDDHGLKAVLMGSGKDEKHLSILLQSGNFVLLRKCGRGLPWEDITNEKSDFSGIKMYSLEEGTSNYHELNGNDYDPIIFESRYGYEFKEGVKCVKITYNNKLLWNHTDDPEYGYLKGLYLDLPKDQFSVTNLKDQTKHLTKPITTVSLDINTTQSTSEYDYTDHKGVVTYTPKSGNVFNKVSHGTTAIWESSDGVCGKLVRTKSKDGVKYLVVLLTNNMFKLFKLEDGKWNDITSQRHDVKKLKFIGDGYVVLRPSDYKVTIMDLSYQYTFNDGINCKIIKYCNEFVWKHTDDPKFSEIMKFHLGLISNNFFVKNSSEFKQLELKPTPETAAVTTTVSVTKPTKETLDIEKAEPTEQFEYIDQSGVVTTYTPNYCSVFNKITQGTKDIWESKDDVHGTLVRTKVSKNVKYLVVLLDNNKFTVFHLDGDEWKDITSKRHDVTKLKFFGEGDRELSKSDYSVSIVDLSFTYIFNDDVMCKKVKLGDDEVWKHTDDSKFAEIKSFSLGLASNSFFVKNQSDQVKKIEKELEAEDKDEAIPDISITVPNITIDSLDIKTSQTITEFDYSKSSDFHKYNPKSGYVFSKVAYENTVIWESKDNPYGTEVMFIEGVKYLVVLMDNNLFKLFHLEDNEWKDTTSKRHDVTKLKFFGEGDRELSKSDYNTSLVDFFYRLKFNTNVKCIKITYNNMELWKNTDDPKFSEITLFSLGLASNSFFVKTMSGHCKKLPEPTEATDSAQQTEESTEAEDPAKPAQAKPSEPATPAQPAEPAETAEPVSSEHSTPDPSSASSS